jgi:tetratricopeptide (TPR) repeat protein
MRQIDQAIAAQRSGDLSQAVTLYRRILAGDSRNFDALYLLGVLYATQNDFKKAERMLRKALAINPNFPPCYHNCGVVLAKLNRYEDAIEILTKGLAIAPHDAPLYWDRGNCEQELGRFRDALASYDKAIALKSDFAAAWLGRGNASFKLKRYQDAILAFDKALALDPRLAGAWLGGGNVFFELARFDDALAAYNNALSVRSDLSHAWLGRGNVLFELKRYGDAFADYDRALAADSGFAAAWRGRGNVLCRLSRYDEALAAYDKALELKSDFADIRFDKACIRLLLGDYEQGWKEYESRWDTQQFAGLKPNFSQQLWLGDRPLANKTILLHAEQGLGDALLACRYVPMVAALGAKVVLEIQPSLAPLLQGLERVSAVVCEGEDLPDFDFQCPLMSLPLAFGTRLNTIPAKVPYVFADESIIDKWRSRLGQGEFKIGVAWAGNPNYGKDRDRSVLLKNILPVFSVEGAKYFSLQKELRDGDAEILNSLPHVTHLGGELADFHETAAIIMSLDLIISSDTSLVNLAGALGRPVWVLLSRSPDWRWLLDRSESPWYPTARLFRQTQDGEWKAVIDDVCTQLKSALSV